MMKSLHKIAQCIAWITVAVLFVPAARADMETAVRAYEAMDYTTAYTLFVAEAEKGNVAAQYRLGVMYATGHGVPQDNDKAKEWFEKAAAQGNPGTQVYLRTLSQRGRLDQAKKLNQQKQVASITSSTASNGQSSAYPIANPKPKQTYEKLLGQKIQKVAGTIDSTLLSSTQIPATFEVNQDPSGNVLSTKIITSSGNAALDMAVERAIARASPLPLPASPLSVSPQIIVACCLPQHNNKEEVGVSVKIAPEKLKNFNRVQELIDVTASPSADPEMQLKQAAETFATLKTHELDPNNPKWNPSHPKWNTVFSAVRSDVEGALPPLMATLTPDLKFSVVMALGDRLTPNDIDSLLHYYRSDEGKRYLQFVGKVDALLMQTQQEAIRSSATRTASAVNQTEPPSKEKFDARSQILQMSRTFRSIQSQMNRDTKMNRDTSGYQATGFLFLPAINRHGADIDLLESQYKDDLTRFENFNRSALARKEVDAEVAAAAALVARMSAAAKELEQDMSLRQAAWRKLYLSEMGS